MDIFIYSGPSQIETVLEEDKLVPICRRFLLSGEGEGGSKTSSSNQNASFVCLTHPSSANHFCPHPSSTRDGFNRLVNHATSPPLRITNCPCIVCTTVGLSTTNRFGTCKGVIQISNHEFYGWHVESLAI